MGINGLKRGKKFKDIELKRCFEKNYEEYKRIIKNCQIYFF